MKNMEYGRTLLVFPAHGYRGMDSKYDENEMLNKIGLISREFDTVMICLHFRDVEKKI